MSCPELLSTTVNGTVTPSPSQTVSRALSLELTFADPVTSALPGSFALTTATFTPRTLTDAPGGGILVSLGTPVVTLTFDQSVPGVDHGSLADGSWMLAVDKSKINAVEYVPDIRRLYGDFNSDGTVDGTDFAAFGNAYGSSTGDPNFDPQADFNGDGTIDGIDFAEFGNRFGKSL
jgi:hypothetical protein